MAAIVRDAPLGQLIQLISPSSFKYHDEGNAARYTNSKSIVQSTTSSDDDVEKAESDATATKVPTKSEETTTIEWDGPQDPDNPHNWSTAKKTFVFGQICLLTFTVYSGSAIIVPAQGDIMTIFGVDAQVSSLVLSMYVLGYGFGPLLFSPLSEIPRIGRNTPYLISFTLFLLVTVAGARVSNFPGLVVIRFLQGFLGGPVLATGGASAGDIFPFHKMPYGLTAWTSAAWAGPALGPLLSGFAVTLGTWRWAMYELLIMCGFTYILLFIALPETNPETILLWRAQRLRKVTGNQELRSQSEIKQQGIHLFKLMTQSLLTPFKVTLQDPSIAFINIYVALIYGIYYSFFESFPIVYVGMHGFSIGLLGVVFICIIVACAIGASIYICLLLFVYEPYTIKNGIGHPEDRLVPGLYASWLVSAGLFMFAWTARPDIHWVVPTIGIVIFSSAIFVTANVIFIYLPTSYPRYAASLFAGNAFLRSALACGAVHFSRPLFENLGVSKGCSVLAGLMFGCACIYVAMWKLGPTLRARSKFAETY